MSIAIIPAEIVRITRSAVLADLGGVAAEIKRASISWGREDQPEVFADPFARFDALRRLLDAVGWSNIDCSIDLDAHREPLTKALLGRLADDRYYVEDPSTEPAACKATERDIERIERFLAANDLREDE